MKKIFVSLLMLFITFSCEIPKTPVIVDNLNIKVEDNVIISANALFNVEINKTVEDYEFGFIIDINSEKIDLSEFKLNEKLSNVTAKVNGDLSFSYVFNELSTFDYILPITIRGYVKNNKGRIFYTKDVLSFVIYQEALKSESSYAKSIVNDVNDNILIDDELSLTVNIDGENKGFNAFADFNEFNDNNIYGILYKYNATIKEQENLSFSTVGYNIFCSNQLNDNILKGIFIDIPKEHYFDDISLRSFIYNETNKTFTFIDETITTTLYYLALLDDSDFSQNVVEIVENSFIEIKEIFINTDVNKEYEVGSCSEGIEVKMFYDYLIVRLTITAKVGYRFSPKIKNKNILILRVDDDIIVDEFTMEVSAFRIVIEYEDYGWGPPM